MRAFLKGLGIAILSLFLLVGALLTWVFWPRYSSATASPDGLIEITMTVSPMFGIHSDWHRELRVSDGSVTRHEKLFEDTGWWRGTNLYRHTSGAYVLDEGQGGCIEIRTEPLEVIRWTELICPSDILFRELAESWPKLTYLGAFHEQNRNPDAWVGFFDKSTTPERVPPGGP